MDDIFRRKFSPLSTGTYDDIDAIKAAAEGLLAIIDRSYQDAAARNDPTDARHKAIARTHLETTVMFAVKGLTS